MKRNRLSYILPNDIADIRYFSLARHALIEALRVAGVGHGDKVLLPEFLCRDLLASISALGATACWYPIGLDLSPSTPPSTWPDAKVVLAVNYFGFPQKLDVFHQYAANSGAIIIEDNAHGFLSRDENGRWLGARTRLEFLVFERRFECQTVRRLLSMSVGFRKSLHRNCPSAERAIIVPRRSG